MGRFCWSDRGTIPYPPAAGPAILIGSANIPYRGDARTMTITDKTISRRDFVRGVGGIGLLSAFPTIIPSSAFGANDTIRIGHIGVKNRGMQNLFPLLKYTV